MKARSVPKFGVCGNCLFNEQSVIVVLHFMAVILGVMSVMQASGDGLTMSFFEPYVPPALKTSVNSCPTDVVGRAPFLYLSLKDYISGEGGICTVEVRLCAFVQRCRDISCTVFTPSTLLHPFSTESTTNKILIEAEYCNRPQQNWKTFVNQRPI
jgi:hypothetical protein